VLDEILLVELDEILLVKLDVVLDDVNDESEVILLVELLLETWLSLLDVVPSPKQPVNKPTVTNPRTIDLMLFFIRFLLSSAISKLFFYKKESKQYL
jgi:hypothetical protein